MVASLSADPLEFLPDDAVLHAYPRFGREHVTDDRDRCWCCPQVEFVTHRMGNSDWEIVGAVITHNVEH